MRSLRAPLNTKRTGRFPEASAYHEDAHAMERVAAALLRSHRLTARQVRVLARIS
jgi:hypothetical protein